MVTNKFATTTGKASAAASPSPATWLGFIAMCIGMFMAILDIQIVATSLPTIQSALAISPDLMSWIQTSYLIAEAITIPLTGLLTQALSLRGLFTLAVALFVGASLGCAASTDFPSLIAWRALQGCAGGTLIPAVFTSVFLLFPGRGQALATGFAGMLAVLAPTIGPIVGGWITATLSWQWLFLVNVGPGAVAAITAASLLPRADADFPALRTFDFPALLLLAVSLAALEIGLKEAPGRGWTSAIVLGVLALSLTSGAAFIHRTYARASPIVDLTELADRNFVLGCALSFILGVGLYGSVYLMPIFLAYVRGHTSLEIGQTMLVTGAAQFTAAPIAVWLERRVSARLLTACGFAMLCVGLALSTRDTPRTDFAEMVLPQAVRGFALMFCLLPPTRLALGHLPQRRVPGASGLFNLMRILGGAIGLAVIDTIVFGRAAQHGEALARRLLRGDAGAFAYAGLPPLPGGTALTPDVVLAARPTVERAALSLAINEAWAMVAALTAVGVLLAACVRRHQT
jgi:MFS transporter, DHA2 family, multidrug resistance protein